MKEGYIYGLMCPYDNIIKYIGQTIQRPIKRLNNHKNDMRGFDARTNWIKKIKKLKLIDKLEIIILEKCDIELLNEKEKYWIKFYIDNGYKLKNSTSGGNCDYRKKDKKSYYGENNPFYGKTHSEEIKKILSEKASKKIGEKNSFYGKTHSEELKQKFSDMYKNKLVKPFHILNDKYEIVKSFYLVSEVLEFFNIKTTSEISRKLNKGKLYKGYYLIEINNFDNIFHNYLG